MKKLFVTGGRGDIGSAIKDIFIKNNYEVIAPTSKELDLENIQEIEQYFQKINKTFDAFIHCAGFNIPKSIEELTIEDIEKTAKINYLSFFQIAKILSNSMKEKKSGKIVAITSLYSTISRSGRLAYTSSKHALSGCVKTLCCELAKYNILVNSVSPGFVDTKMTRKNNSKEKIELLTKKIPMKRLALPLDIAKTVYYLASDDNTYINGQDIIVDGGFITEGGQES